jgi:hypothetical protein
MITQVAGWRILEGTAETMLVSPPLDSLIFVCSSVKESRGFSKVGGP